MKALRLILLGLAAVVFVALGWRLTVWPDRARIPPATVATATPPERTAPPLSAPLPSGPAAPPAPAQSVGGLSAQAPAPIPAPAQTMVVPPPSPTPLQPTAIPPAALAPTLPPALPPASPPATRDDARQAMMAQLGTVADLAKVFAAAQSAFPAAVDKTLDTVADDRLINGDTVSPDDLVAALMRDLRATSGVLAARASPEALAAIFDAKATTLSDLQAADPRICADYLFGGSSPEFNDFAIAHRALVARQDLATIAAMADGRTRQINREPPSNGDYALIEAALRGKGLSADEIAAVLDGKSLDPPPSDSRLCDNARAYLDAMRDMPADARDRVYGLAAELLARS